MMPQARIGDFSMGHWIGPFYFPPVPLVTGSPDDTSCCIPSCRVTDIASPHFGWLFGIVPIPPFIHTPVASSGSKSVFIDPMLEAFRVGDNYACGDIQAQGCHEKLVGD